MNASVWHVLGLGAVGVFGYEALDTLKKSKDPVLASQATSLQQSAATFGLISVGLLGLTLWSWNDPSRPLLGGRR